MLTKFHNYNLEYKIDYKSMMGTIFHINNWVENQDNLPPRKKLRQKRYKVSKRSGRN